MLAAMFGGDTLHELRVSCNLAEEEVQGGVSQRVSPLAQVSIHQPDENLMLCVTIVATAGIVLVWAKLAPLRPLLIDWCWKLSKVWRYVCASAQRSILKALTAQELQLAKYNVNSNLLLFCIYFSFLLPHCVCLLTPYVMQ